MVKHARRKKKGEGWFEYDLHNMEFNTVEYLGIIAGSFSVVAGVAQVYRLADRKSADDISWIFIGAAITSTSLWVTYHFLKRGGGPFLTTSLTLIGLFIVAALKSAYGQEDGKDHLCRLVWVKGNKGERVPQCRHQEDPDAGYLV